MVELGATSVQKEANGNVRATAGTEFPRNDTSRKIRISVARRAGMATVADPCDAQIDERREKCFGRVPLDATPRLASDSVCAWLPMRHGFVPREIYIEFSVTESASDQQATSLIETTSAAHAAYRVELCPFARG